LGKYGAEKNGSIRRYVPLYVVDDDDGVVQMGKSMIGEEFGLPTITDQPWSCLLHDACLCKTINAIIVGMTMISSSPITTVVIVIFLIGVIGCSFSVTSLS
jgi:hypothetical protein